MRQSKRDAKWFEINRIRTLEIKDRSNIKSKDGRRNMGANLINDWFYGCERHHINNNDIICIPGCIHRKYYHDHNKPDTMIRVNRRAFEYLTSSITCF